MFKLTPRPQLYYINDRQGIPIYFVKTPNYRSLPFGGPFTIFIDSNANSRGNAFESGRVDRLILTKGYSEVKVPGDDWAKAAIFDKEFMQEAAGIMGILYVVLPDLHDVA
jgi:hypothetical protein